MRSLAAIVLGASAAAVLVGVGILWAIVELDDGRHDIFGSESRSTVSPAQPHRLALVR